MAEFERALIQERVRAGLRNTRATARPPTRLCGCRQNCLLACGRAVSGGDCGRTRDRQRNNAACACRLAQSHL